MDKKIIKGLIDEKLEVIQEQFSIIKSYEGKIPMIELDLIMTNIRDLYELIINLQMENIGGVIMPKPQQESETQKVTPTPDPAPAPSPEPVPPQRITPSFISIEPVVEKIPETIPQAAPEPPADIMPEIPESPASPVTEPVIEIIPEPLIQEAPEPEIQEIPVTTPAPEPFAENDPQPEKSQKITFDLFSSGTGTTLADRLREGQDKSLADKLQEHKVVDLRTTIGINDKFLFINELFEGNMRIYDDVIQKLNSAVTMAQADLLMLDLKIAYNWDSESPTVKKFVDLIRRKF